MAAAFFVSGVVRSGFQKGGALLVFCFGLSSGLLKIAGAAPPNKKVSCG
jgi:hypothetical protein